MSEVVRKGKKISLWGAIAIVVGNMIGTGVFTSLGFQLGDIKTGFPIALLWTLGGVIALCGAFCYAELSSALTRSGGEYHFLSTLTHPLVGFLSGWVSITVGFAAPIALAAMAFGDYFAQVVPGIPAMWMSLATVILVTVIHAVKLDVASRFQTVFSLGKLLLIVALIVLAFSLGDSQGMHWYPVEGDLKVVFQAPFAISLMYVLYSYMGWNASAYIAGEVVEPNRNVPLSLIIGTGIVMVLYVLLNMAFIYSTPMDELVGKKEVGVIVAKQVLGEQGGAIMGGLICFGLISSISAMVWAGSRISAVMGQDHKALRFLAKEKANGIPIAALLTQLALVILLILTNSFEPLLNYTTFLLTISSFLAVSSVLVLRKRYGKDSLAYRMPLYPLPLVIFLSTHAWIAHRVFVTKTHESLLGLLTLAIGWLIYVVSNRKRPPTA